MKTECRILSGAEWWPTLRGRLIYATSAVNVSMFLFSPNWHDRQLNIIKDFCDIAERGVQCHIILSAHPMRVGRKRPNLEAADKLQRAGWKVRVMGGNQALHEKVIVIDDTAAFVGSHNLSYSAVTTNYDTSVMLEGQEATEILTRQFWQRWRLAESPEARGFELTRPIKLGWVP